MKVVRRIALVIHSLVLGCALWLVAGAMLHAPHVPDRLVTGAACAAVIAAFGRLIVVRGFSWWAPLLSLVSLIAVGYAADGVGHAILRGHHLALPGVALAIAELVAAIGIACLAWSWVRHRSVPLG